MRGRGVGIAVLFAAAAIAQIGPYPGGYPPGSYPPGQYPPGQYPQTGPGIPGIHLPHRGKKAKEAESQTTVSVTGVLRRMTASEAVLDIDDKRVVSVGVSAVTKYARMSEQGIKDAVAADFKPGDHVSVDATQDDHDFLHAAKITLVNQATAADRARVARESREQEAIVGPGAADTSGNSDDERPRLHRGGAQQTKPAQTADDPQAQAQAQAEAQNPPPVEPDHPLADPQDAPPKLHRGKPPKQQESVETEEPQQPRVAENRLPPRPSQAEPAAVPPSSATDTRIAKARDAATSFTETLPNYLVKQVTTRFVTDRASREHTSWQPVDNVTADVVYEDGKESYRNVLINGKAPKERIERTGSWSTGEFASVLRDVFSPATNARFRAKGDDRIDNRSARVYEFSVLQRNSHWHVEVAGQAYFPEYTGNVWIDDETSRVLRIEMQARHMPDEFPLDHVESATDYDFVRIGERKFLLPVHSENLSCERGTSQCSRNVIDFRNYRKFGADTDITFGPEK